MTSGYLIEPHVAGLLQLGGVGVTVELASERLAGRAAAVRGQLDARRVMPPHLHQREDEVTFVLRGPVGVQVGDEEFEAPSGSLVVGPRDLFHAFWSPGDDTVVTSKGVDPSEVSARRATSADRYGVEHSQERLDALRERYGLRAMGE